MATSRSPLAEFREVECAKCEAAGRNGEATFEVTIAGQLAGEETTFHGVLSRDQLYALREPWGPEGDDNDEQGEAEG